MTEATTNAFTRDSLFADAKEFGKAEGKGTNAKISLAARACEAAHKLVDVTPDDAKDIVAAYSEAAARNRGQEYKPLTSAAKFTSEIRQFLNVGKLPMVDGPRLVDRTMIAIKEMAKTKDALKGSAYDNLVRVMRAQVASPEEELSDDEITDVLTPEEGGKSEVERLCDVFKASVKSRDKFVEGGLTPPEALDLAIDNLRDAIVEAGGEVPPLTGEGKKRAAFLKRAAAMGLKLAAD
jgi:hypothetical protein